MVISPEKKKGKIVMDIKSSVDLMATILAYLLPVVLVVNVTMLLVNMSVSAMFKGKLSIKVE